MRKRQFLAVVLLALAALPAAGILWPVGAAFPHEYGPLRVSLSSGGAQADGPSRLSAISRDGRYVVFESDASNLVAGDTNGVTDVFLHDRVTAQTVRVSVASDGTQGDGPSTGGSVARRGTGEVCVAFDSWAANLVPADSNATEDVFVRCLPTGETTRVSTDVNGVQGNGPSYWARLSGDGGWLAFLSAADNLVAGDSNARIDAFNRLLAAPFLARVSLGTGGIQADGDTSAVETDFNGQLVALETAATNLVPGDTNGHDDIFVAWGWPQDPSQAIIYDWSSVAAGGGASNGEARHAALVSHTTGYVAFDSSATDLVAGDTNGYTDVFARGVPNQNFTVLVSAAADGTQGNRDSTSPARGGTSDGRWIAFQSSAGNLVTGDTNGYVDIFVWDFWATPVRMRRISLGPGGAQANGDSGNARVSAAADTVAFDSLASNLVPGDTNALQDVFVYDLGTPLSSATPSATHTATFTPTPTYTPGSTPCPTPTDTPTGTLIPTPSATATPTATLPPAPRRLYLSVVFYNAAP